MKLSRYVSRLAVLVTISLGACDNFLGYDESVYYTKEQAFETFSRTKNLLSNLYSYLPTDYNVIDGAMRSSGTDDAVHVWDFSAIRRFNNGSWSPLLVIDHQWPVLYMGVRSANLFLQEIDTLTFSDIRYNDEYSQLMAQFHYYPFETRFLRAYMYFELIKRYGDVPLITEVLTEEEANQAERTPFEEVVQFIVSECDDLALNLPVSYGSVPGNETGRATKGAVLALKARVLLYAASPLHNLDNAKENWTMAATASKALIDSGWYSLETDYSAAFNNLASPELILETRQGESNSFESANFPIGYIGGNTGTCPTQNLVDAYEMQKTGRNISERGSGFDAKAPYEGRDPRFYASILYNGAAWKDSTIECWYGGFNGPPNERATKTGYYLKKYLIESISLEPANTTSIIHVWALFRYGEILLNYAEAMNEAYGPEVTGTGSLNMTAIDAVNLIRERSQMPPFPKGMSQRNFREKLRNERRVELAFEDHRFWDIRRWKIGPQTSKIEGVDVLRNSAGKISYVRKIVENRIWDDRMYLYPLTVNELNINRVLEQNPGW